MENREDNDIENYIIVKSALSMIFNIEFDDNIEFLYDLDLLQNIKFRIKCLTSEGSITQLDKEKIYNFLMEVRNIYDEDRDERIEIINEIIGYLNNEIPDNNLMFYRYQLYIRTGNLKYLTSKYSNKYIIDLVNHINISIGYDAIVLNALHSSTSDEKFISNYLRSLADNPYYIESINSIIYENPQLFKDLTFYNRNMCVLNSLNNDIYRENKRMIKKIEKKLKKI